MLAADTFMIAFRFLHILAGVLWVGSAFLFVGVSGLAAWLVWLLATGVRLVRSDVD